MAYQVQRVLTERGDSLPVHEKARAENAVTEARQALSEQAPLERMRVLTDELQQIYQILGAPPQGPPPEPEPEVPPNDDDVIDAEFTAHE
jgi:molecular chaperone DnaK